MSLVKQLLEDIHSYSSANMIIELIKRLPYEDKTEIENIQKALKEREKVICQMEIEDFIKQMKCGEEILSENELKLGEEYVIAYALDWTKEIYSIRTAKVIGLNSNKIEFITNSIKKRIKGYQDSKFKYLRFFEDNYYLQISKYDEFVIDPTAVTSRRCARIFRS